MVKTALLLFTLTAPMIGISATLTFEGLADGTSVTNQYSGVTFLNTTALNAGVSLPVEFPPHSGIGVVFDDGGPITIAFASPVISVGGFFTYAAPVNVYALDAADKVLAQVTSSASENFVGAGSPNEFLQVTVAGGFTRLRIMGDVAGTSVVLDDLTYSNANAVPEPSTFGLLTVGVATAGVTFRRRRKQDIQ